MSKAKRKDPSMAKTAATERWPRKKNPERVQRHKENRSANRVSKQPVKPAVELPELKPPDPSHHAYTPHRSGDDGRCYYTSDFANFCGASVEAHASAVQEQPAEDTMQEETIPVPTEPKPEGE